MLLRLNCYIVNLSASLEISLSHQAVYYYLLDNLVSGPSFVPTVIAALHPSNITYWLFGGGSDGVKFLTEDLLDLCAHWERFRSTDVLAYS